jgi:hypothetical protein
LATDTLTATPATRVKVAGVAVEGSGTLVLDGAEVSLVVEGASDAEALAPVERLVLGDGGEDELGVELGVDLLAGDTEVIGHRDDDELVEGGVVVVVDPDVADGVRSERGDDGEDGDVCHEANHTPQMRASQPLIGTVCALCAT